MTFSSFLDTFVPLVQNKSKQVNQAVWILETTGSEDAAILKAELETELRMFFFGKELAPSILELVELRNQAAKSLGYDNYFSMQLKLQEVDEKWLFETLDALALESNVSYSKVLQEISENASKQFNVDVSEIGP